MSVIYSFVFIYLMSAFAETIAWICVVLAQLALIGASVVSYFWRQDLIKTLTDGRAEWEANNGESLIKENEKNQKLALTGLVLFAVLAAAFLLCVCCGFKSLKLAIDVIDASADFLAGTKRIIFVPVLYFFLQVIVFFVWLYAFLHVASMNEFKPDTGIIP